MKLWYVAIIILLLFQLVSAPVMANSFTEIPAEHWIYQVFRPLVNKGLISYQVDLGEEFTLSRYEAAMLIAKILEELVPLPVSEREELQVQIITSLIDQELYKLDVTLDTAYQRLHYFRTPTRYPTIFGLLDLETIEQIEQAIVETIRQSSSPTYTAKYTAENMDLIRGIFRVAVELYEEVNALGFELTALERDLPKYSVIIQNKYVLDFDVPHSIVNSKLSSLLGNPVLPVTDTTLNEQGILDMLDNRAGSLPTTELRLKEIDPEENSKGDDWQLGMGIFQDSFAPYRLIDFASTSSL